jgi:riboflavin synthase
VFTGIVETTVAISAVGQTPSARRLTLPCPWVDAALGQSVAVNGCCLTIAALSTGVSAGVSAGVMDFDVVPQTLSLTNLGLLKAGDEVHLERPLRVGDRLDGHIVQGHIDGVAKIIARQATEQECRLTVRTPREFAAQIVPKGSVTLDGVSLTLAAVREGEFEVALIPTTLAATALGRRPVGWPLNLETDILAKTIVFWLERQANVRQSPL